MPSLAVLGHPVAHSKSPAMQNAALDALGLEGWEYGSIDVRPDDFRQLVQSLPGRGFAGANVTIPHKRAALEVADSASDAADAIGAANTLTFTPDGIHADNTDAPGLIAAVRDQMEELKGRTGMVLGAGGASRAVIWALAEAGIAVSLWNRTSSRADVLAAEFGVETILAGPDAGIDPGHFDVIVNASAAGLETGDALAELPLDPGGFRSGQVVVDMVYGASGSGSLIETAERAGAQTIDGLEILVRQGAESLEIWTGREPDLDVMRRAVRK
ncbi:MAG: shikimate dehydrogenase [Solirubrobacterales bacterium]|nr:shikimate dehydrogenase [Solirubrobacterales bacterium]HMT04847.1 shikimate dehydrogenase [Solirubrobacterales bacterium]